MLVGTNTFKNIGIEVSPAVGGERLHVAKIRTPFHLPSLAELSVWRASLPNSGTTVNSFGEDADLCEEGDSSFLTNILRVDGRKRDNATRKRSIARVGLPRIGSERLVRLRTRCACLTRVSDVSDVTLHDKENDAAIRKPVPLRLGHRSSHEEFQAAPAITVAHNSRETRLLGRGPRHPTSRPGSPCASPRGCDRPPERQGRRRFALQSRRWP